MFTAINYDQLPAGRGGAAHSCDNLRMRGTTRGARLAALVLIAGCGARTDLFGVPPDDFASDAGGAPDGASGVLDASGHAESGVIVLDAAALDADIDAAAIACIATGPTPIANDGAAWIDQLALDSHTVYFHDQAGLHRVGKSGGAVTSVYPLMNYVAPDLGAFGANDDGVTFWQSHPNPPSSTFDVLHVGPLGGAPVKLATLTGMAGRGTIDNLDRTFVIADDDRGNSSVIEVAPDGATTTVPTVSDPGLVRSDGIDTYFTITAGLFRATKTSPVMIGVLQPYTYFVDFIFDGATIYFTAYDVDNNVVAGAMAKQGGATPTVLWSSSSVSLSGMDQDTTFIYVADRGKPAIVRIRKDGTGSDEIITGAHELENFNDVKVDDRCIYYSYVSYAATITGKGSVFAMPK
jgi:hypothetical protein